MKIPLISIGIVVVLLLVIILLGAGTGEAPPDYQEVKKQHEDSLVAMEGVTGVCTYPDTHEIVVMIEDEHMAATIPQTIDGYPVTVVVTGKLTAHVAAAPLAPAATPFPDSDSPPFATTTEPARRLDPAGLNAYAASITPTGIARPLIGGISVGNAGFPGSAGTLGLVVTGAEGDGLYGLGCAHVLALGRDGMVVPPGTPVLQPAGSRAPAERSRIGNLTHFTAIAFSRSGVNYADAAITRLEVDGLPGLVLDAANGTFYTLNGTTTVTRGDTVRKSGITTGVTTGQVIATDAIVRVFFTDDQWAVFRDQVLTGTIGSAGDSGSAVDRDGRFVGLYFAGSDTAGVICKAEHILGPLGVTI